MTPEQRCTAGRAVDNRIHELDTSVPKLATQSGISEPTIRRLIHGRAWPSAYTRHAIEEALHWPEGEIARRATHQPGDLSGYSIDELLDEVRRRCQG